MVVVLSFYRMKDLTRDFSDNVLGLYVQAFFKRFIDTVLSLVDLIICFIPMMIISIAIKLDSPGPVLFRQKRIGYKCEIYEIWKFKSICVGAEHQGSVCIQAKAMLV